MADEEMADVSDNDRSSDSDLEFDDASTRKPEERQVAFDDTPLPLTLTSSAPAPVGEDPPPSQEEPTKTPKRSKPKPPRALRGISDAVKAAENDLRDRKKVLQLYGAALDKVAAGLPKNLKRFVEGASHSCAASLAQHLGLIAGPFPLPQNPPAQAPAQAPAATHTAPSQRTAPGPQLSYAQVASSAPSQPSSDSPKILTPKPKQNKGNGIVIVTLPPEGRQEAPHPHTVKQQLAEAGRIESLWPTRTGYALKVSGPREEFLSKAQPALAKLGADGRAATPSYSYVVRRTPLFVRGLSGKTEITEAAIAVEAANVTRKKVIRASWSLHDVGNGLERTAVVHFQEKPSKEFRLFCSSAPSRPMQKTARVNQCTRCWRFHEERNCRFGHRCMMCGSGNREHDCPGLGAAKCSNCCGPHPANHQKCPARPVPQIDGSLRRPGVEQRQEIRRNGVSLSKQAQKGTTS